MKLKLIHIISLLLLILFSETINAQISPGDLSKAHQHLEGMSNCVKCHILGEKEVPNAKCLDCHKEINNLIKAKRGYHASTEVKGKTCVSCHNEHHGKNFEIIKFNKDKFNHQLTTFDLKGKHATLKCEECHKKEFIKENRSQRKSGSTYLGMNNECLACHEDYHQKTLSSDCASCHNFEAFKPAPGFDHQKTKFVLKGAHKKVDCIECHKITQQNSKKYQQFTGIKFAQCTDCHDDVHNNQFGNDCLKCHTEDSFHTADKSSSFNHDQTQFPLQGKHKTVDCKACHKRDYITPLKHNLCSDCHVDYHNGQFTKVNQTPDCNTCHTNDGFTPSTYTLEKHNLSQFPLKGGHLATPCLACHQKGERWEFREIGKKCTDCHEDIHKGFIDQKYYPNQNCESCHNEMAWNQIKFDHNTTTFALNGEHAKQSCRECHFPDQKEGIENQRFSSLKSNCETCHTDVHLAQFKQGDQNDCLQCHGFNDWKAEKFDHNKTNFKLDGGHQGVACKECHKEVKTERGTYIQYKFEEVKCSNCHSSLD